MSLDSTEQLHEVANRIMNDDSNVKLKATKNQSDNFEERKSEWGLEKKE
jgi:hypothetical protein